MGKQIYNKPVRTLIREMTKNMALDPGHTFTTEQALRWFDRNYPKIKPNTIRAHLSRFTTNDYNRIHYGATNKDDLLFRVAPAEFRLYEAGSDPTPICYKGRPAAEILQEVEDKSWDDLLPSSDLERAKVLILEILESYEREYNKDKRANNPVFQDMRSVMLEVFGSIARPYNLRIYPLGGKGYTSKIPYISFLAAEHRVSRGIYPLININYESNAIELTFCHRFQHEISAGLKSDICGELHALLPKNYSKSEHGYPQRTYSPTELDVDTLGRDLHDCFLAYLTALSKFSTEVDDYLVDEEAVEDERKQGRSYWWLNSNPKKWDLTSWKIGQPQWYTSKNERGNNRQKYRHFQQAQVGDRAIGYISTPRKEAVCVLEVTKALHEREGHEVVEFTKRAEFSEPISWEALKANPKLKECEPLHNNQGSLFRLEEEEFETICALGTKDDEVQEQVQPYNLDNALKDLFIPKERVQMTLSLLKRKKNIILQGPPGVGKTYVAKRLAYAQMGNKDDSRICMVQFHQSYSYEDFVQGIRPDGNGGFQVKNGLLYEFCRKARNNAGQDYFFIIDEVNRGNLSKIFGELMMLLEHDKRGDDFAIPLTYSNSLEETFYIPENVYFIGTMNTADRSLAIVDYALRRRFAFIDIEPAFSSMAFTEFLTQKGVPSSVVTEIQSKMLALNEKIESNTRDLGKGFCVGHSYFCPNGEQRQNFDNGWYREIIEFEVAPLLREYWFDDTKEADNNINELMS